MTSRPPAEPFVPDDLDRLLGITGTPLELLARDLVAADNRLLDDLVEARVAAGLTRADLADRLDWTEEAVARVEAGERDPRLSTLRRYALAVGARIEHSVTVEGAEAQKQT